MKKNYMAKALKPRTNKKKSAKQKRVAAIEFMYRMQ